jgi:hypothetical protein
MPKVCYENHKFSAKSLEMLQTINRTVLSYSRQGFSLTLRQMYYRLVAADAIPNNDKSYKMVGELVNNARLAGYIDWTAIEDRTRELEESSHWSSPGSIIDGAAYSYNIDKWVGQEYRVMVLVEKDALKDIVGKACGPLDVAYFSCRGYMSATAMWNMSQTLLSYWVDHGQKPVILHLGDHDPSGIDMSRDIQDRLYRFCNHATEDEGFFGPDGNWDGEVVEDWPGIEFYRIALNKDQILQYNPPPNPTKLTDSRAADYIREHGNSSWELDSLEPAVLTNLIETEIENYLDRPAFDARVAQQEKERETLTACAQHWGDVASYLDRGMFDDND